MFSSSLTVERLTVNQNVTSSNLVWGVGVWFFFLFFFMKTLFNINFIGTFKDISVKSLKNDFEYNLNSNNYNMFIFRNELPALVSIIKRFSLYLIIVLLFTIVFLLTCTSYSLFSIVIIKFIVGVFIFLNFLLIIFYSLNSYFVNKKSKQQLL